MDQESQLQQRRARVSSIMDGQADAQEVADWWTQEAHDPQTRADWHLYHLIGDTLRSSELASTPEADQRLAQAVSRSLAHEPTVLAPAALKLPRVRRRLWAASAAAAAGFLVVGAAYFVTRLDDGGTSGSSGIGLAASPLTDDLRRASISPDRREASSPLPWVLRSPVADFREILRLPRGPEGGPHQAVQVLYSNGAATISVVIEPFRAGEHQPRAEMGERLNTLSLQRQDVWLTLSGDVPLGTLHQMAASLQPQP